MPGGVRNRGRGERRRSRPVLAATIVFALALGAGTSQAQVGDELDRAGGLGGPLDEVGDALDDVGGGGAGDLPAKLDCRRARLGRGLCPGEGEGPGSDFQPYGEADEEPGRQQGRRATRTPDRRTIETAGATGTTLNQTTIDQTIAGTGDPADGFQTLLIDDGEPTLVREDLADAESGREQRRSSLLYVGQTTDWQLADEESPARVEFLDISANPPFPNLFGAAWRPQEAFGPFAVEQSIRQLNEFAPESPHRQGDGSRAAMDMVLMTGDNADNQQLNETEWVVTLLEGGELDPNSGTDEACPEGQEPSGQTAEPEKYAGVQDYEDYFVSPGFWDPNDPQGDFSEFPEYPGLMDRAQLPFDAGGLDVPSYVVFGNHDGLAQGNQKALKPFEDVGTGCLKPLIPITNPSQLPNALDPAVLEALLGSIDPEDVKQVMRVPPDEQRQYVDKIQYKELFDTGAQADAHGFGLVDQDQLDLSDDTASYYSWSPKPGIRLIGLDTLCDAGIAGPGALGNLDDPQFEWLRGELEAASEADELIVVFGHHPISSLICTIPDESPPDCSEDDDHGHDQNPGCDRDPRPSGPIHDGGELTDLFHEFPHVITYIAGHTHENAIGEFDQAGGGQGDFWGIETASMVDWPPQNRLIELMDNCDGTLSIFGTTIDNAAPATAPEGGTEAAGLSGSDLASISRTIAFNDPQAGAGTGEGEPLDRNVELLLDDPRDEPSACTAGAGDPDGGETQPEPGGSGELDDDSGVLPFTGMVLLGLVIAGGALLGGGRLLRALTRREH